MGRFRIDRRLCLRVLLCLTAALMSVAWGRAALAQSGYQTIQGTRVFTEVFQSQGYARFSNECGSQTLTQGQLQAGAIPSNIIPCPRVGGSAPRSNAGDPRQVCSDGSRCPGGHLCMRNNRCVPFNSERYCGGRSYCEQGFACAEKGKCVPLDSPRYCGNKRYCSEGFVCAEKGKCIAADSERYCGNKRYCEPGSACIEGGKCISTSSERYCGKKSYCSEGYACAEAGKCISVTSPRYCGSKRYCEPGFMCSNGITCTQIATPIAPPATPTAPAAAPAEVSRCERDNKINVDWVIASDKMALERFESFRAAGLSGFEAVVAAQAHNPPVQAQLRTCRDWVSAYLAARGVAGGSGDPRPDPGRAPDCRCASVVPTGVDRGMTLGKEYRVINSCARMGISVKLLDKGNTSLSTWIDVGDLDMGDSRLIHAPQAHSIPSINGIQVRGSTASQVCSFF